MRLNIVILLLLTNLLVNGQQKHVLGDTCDVEWSIKISYGDTVISHCHTLYVISSQLRNRIKRNTREEDEIINEFQSQLDTTIQDLKFAVDSYKDLHKSYKELSKNSQIFISESSKILTETSQSLKNANDLSVIAKDNINGAIELVKKEKRSAFWKDFAKVGGGIVIGGAIGVLGVLAANSAN